MALPRRSLHVARALVRLGLAVSMTVPFACGGDSLPKGACRKSSDCDQSYQSCSAPGTLNCGHISRDCASDADCAKISAGLLCISKGCSTSCMAPCAPSDCVDGQVCGASGRCETKPCKSAPDCPINFACTSGHCARASCSDDSSCSGNCVNGQCYSTFGKCDAPAP